MAEMLKVLTEASSDNLFVITGLVLLVIAVVGNVSSQIKPGKSGRMAAAIVSPLLIATGLWIHWNEHVNPLMVVCLDFQAENNAYEGPCPIELEFPGQIQASGHGTVVYEVEFSDGDRTPPLELDFDRGATRQIKTSRRFLHSGANGWARLIVRSPSPAESAKTFFSVTCQNAALEPKVRQDSKAIKGGVVSEG